MEKIQSTCNYCSLACNLDFYVENNHVERVIPTEGYPVNHGFCCIKGLNLDKQNTKYNPPNKPFIKAEEGKKEEIEWDEAFKIFASKMTEIQRKYGKESVAYLSTGQMPTEDIALLGHVGRNFMGINGDGNTRQCMATSVVAHKQSFGFDAPPYTLKDAELSDTIIIIGGNPVIAHPVFWGRVKDNKEAKVITVDPRKSETVLNSDVWIDIKPKQDIFLFYTLANVLIEKGWIDNDFIEAHTEGFQNYKEFVAAYTLENVEEKTGISKSRVLELAEIIHKGSRVSFWWTMGVNQGAQAVRTAQSIINLALLTGNIGKPGTGPNSLTGQCNAMGSRVFSNTTGLYGGGDYDNENRRLAVSEALGINQELLPQKPTLPYNVIIEKVIAGEIKALWVIHTNPRHSWANNEIIEKAFKNLEFLVVQDIYEDTDSAVFADLMLPAANCLFKEGVIINTERRLSSVVPVLKKEEHQKTDYEIFLGIGEALGMGSLLDNWKTPKDTFELMKKCSKGMPCDITGVDYYKLRNSKGIQWPFREGEELTDDQRRLYEDGNFYTPNKKAKFIFEDVGEYPISISEEYPYILNSGRGTVGQWHTQTRTREIPTVEKISPKEDYVFINPKLAEKHSIKNNDKVLIESSNGVKKEFYAKLTDNVKEDQLYAPIHYINTNSLTPSLYDTYSKEPAYKLITVNIKKIS